MYIYRGGPLYEIIAGGASIFYAYCVQLDSNDLTPNRPQNVITHYKCLSSWWEMIGATACDIPGQKGDPLRCAHRPLDDALKEEQAVELRFQTRTWGLKLYPFYYFSFLYFKLVRRFIKKFSDFTSIFL